MSSKDDINCTIGIKDLIDFEFNITDKGIQNLSLDNSTDLVKLYDDRLVFGVKNLTGDLGFNYMYILDPPIFSDIGMYDWNLTSLTFIVDMYQYFNDEGDMNITINHLDVDIQPWRMTFDGISDISQVATSFISYVGTVLTNRLTSIVAYT